MGLHKYKSIIDLFEKYLYQDLEQLYEIDLGEYPKRKKQCSCQPVLIVHLFLLLLV